MISYCGLDCDTCPIHLATLETDPAKQRVMRTDIAVICNEKYGMSLGAADVNDCDGCLTETGRLFSGCLNCPVRPCAISKKVDNCRSCEDYKCEKLKSVIENES